MKDTKHNILTEALAQFNDLGVEKVTTRHVASALNISQGNLHYHYPNKEVLLVELYRLFEKELVDSQHFEGKSISLETLKKSMLENYKIMYKYRFLFMDRDVVWRKCPDIETGIKLIMENFESRLNQLIKVFQKDGIIIKALSEDQLQQITKQFYITILTWLNAASYFEFNSDNEMIEWFVEYTFNLWKPYLAT